jgi:hypothetical protein
VSVTGVQAVGQVGTVTTQANANIYLTGVQAQGIIGQVLVWGQIPDVPDPGWTNINNSGTSGWSQIPDNAVTDWELIAA